MASDHKAKNGAKRVQIHPRAYIKAMLHTCKYPRSSVNGVLIGTSAHNIVDAFPLLHTPATVLPPLEIGLMHVEELLNLLWEEENGNDENGAERLKIVGYYFANEHLLDKSVGRAHEAIIDKIRENCFSNSSDNGEEEEPCVWMLDNERMQIEKPRMAVNLCRRRRRRRRDRERTQTHSNQKQREKQKLKNQESVWDIEDLSDQEKNGDLFSFLRNGTRFSTNRGSQAFEAKGENKGGASGSPRPDYEFPTEEVLKAFKLLMQQKKHYRLFDFDDHLDDVSLDWTNSALTDEIDAMFA